jgi:hypothetical protein
VPKRPETGEIVHVFNKKNRYTFSINEGPSYFKGLIENYLILDIGTSSERVIEIYNLDTKKIVFKSDYCSNLIIVNKTIHFWSRVDIKDVSKKPKCSPKFNPAENEIGFIEERIFNFKSLQLTKTGNYECTQFE